MQASKMTRNSPIRSLLILALVLGSPLAHAVQAYNESRAVESDGVIHFQGVEGEIRVRSGNNDQWQLSGELADSVKRVDISGDESSWDIEIKYSKGRHRNGGGTDLVLEVPNGINLVVKMVSANIVTDDLSGNKVKLITVSGDIDSEAAPNYLVAEAVSGDIQLQAAGRMETKLEAVSGDISVNGGQGELEASVVSGQITVRNASLHRAKLQSVSGDIELGATLDQDSNVDVEAHSGDITLNLSGDLELDLEVDTFSGSIKSDWGKVKRNRRGPGSSLDYREGSGDTRLNISNFSGDVDIFKR